MAKKILIIGAGISGLTAGIYARRAGFDTEIFESHKVVGGECTGWNRKGYHIDGCIHWLTGSKKGTGLYKIWETCGALGNGTEIYNSEYIVATYQGDTLCYLYTQVDKMERELLRISPEDHQEIKKFVKAVKWSREVPVITKHPFDFLSFFQKIAMLLQNAKFIKMMLKTSSITAKDYASRFKSPVIRRLLSSVVPDHLPANTLLFTVGIRTLGDGGWPVGGSYQFAQRMKRKFEEYGGIIHTDQRVKQIVVRDKKAVGIRLENSKEEIGADYIVPAIDAHELLCKLLEDKYEDDYFHQRFRNPGNYILLSATLISLGIHADMKDYPEFFCIELRQPLQINGTGYKELSFKNYSFDKELNKNGYSLITSVINDKEYAYWKDLKENNPDVYAREKLKVANTAVDELVYLYPELEGKIEMTDVATPATFNRYCHLYQGAYMSFFPGKNVKRERHKSTIDGIDNLFMAGQWVFPNGGLPLAATAGKFAIQRICKKEGMSIVLD